MGEPRDKRRRAASARNRQQSTRSRKQSTRQSAQADSERQRSARRQTLRQRRKTQGVDPYASVTDIDKPDNVKRAAKRSATRSTNRSTRTSKPNDPVNRAERRRQRSARTTKQTDDATKNRRSRRRSSVLNEQAPTTRRLRETINPDREPSAEVKRSISRETKRFRTNILRENVEIREAERVAEFERQERLAEEEKRRIALADPIDASVQYSGKGERVGVDSRIAVALVILCAVIFGIVVMVLMREAPKQTKPPVYVAKKQPRKNTQANTNRGVIDADVQNTDVTPTPKGPSAPKDFKFVEEKKTSGSLLSDAVTQKSEHHKTLASFLEEFNDIRNAQQSGDGVNPFEGYRERQRRENELLERIRSLGPDALSAMADLVNELSGHPFQMFLARAVASMDDDSARKTAATLLVGLKDYSVRMQLVKSLPLNEGSTRIIGESIGQVKDANLRVMLVRELAHRTRDNQDNPESSEHFRKLALEDSNPTVRAEAIAVMGRRKLEGQRDVLEQIVRNDKHATVRQRAIVSLARTAGKESIYTLQEVATSKAEDSVRASAVLGLTLIGEPALRILEDIAREDQSPDIRNRAKRAIQAIQRSIQTSPGTDDVYDPGR